MLEFIGRFHPLWVHLPIGIIVLALGFKALSMFKAWAFLEKVLPITLAFGFLTAVGSSITGYLLSLSGEYGAELLTQHQYAGIILTVLTGVSYWLLQRGISKKIEYALWGAMAILLGITGHWGGSMTHGEDFLAFSSDKKPEKPVITNLDEAVLYTDLVQPVLESKCYTCHSSKKQKGKLRLDGQEWIEKGGDEGMVLVAHDPSKSPLYERLVLSELDELHMPPKGKPQPSEAEIELIEWWIAQGASFDQPLKEITGYAEKKSFLEELVSYEEAPKQSYLPEGEVTAANLEDLEALQALGAMVIPVALNSNYLSVNFLGKKDFGAEDLAALEKVKAQIAWLKLDNTPIVDSTLEVISGFDRLSILHVNHTAITDAGISQLAALKALKHLNLTYTAVTEQGLESLAELPELTKLYLFETKVDADKWGELKALFPGVELDRGGYVGQFKHLDKELGRDSVREEAKEYN